MVGLELLEKFLEHAKPTPHIEDSAAWTEDVTEAKQCALICVDEMRELLKKLL